MPNLKTMNVHGLISTGDVFGAAYDPLRGGVWIAGGCKFACVDSPY